MGTLLKRYLLIYLATVGGMVLTIMSVFFACDLAERMKPGDQILFTMPGKEVNEYEERLLKIYVWENVWNSDQTAQYTRLTDMQKGEVIFVGPKIKKDEFNGNTVYIEDIPNTGNITYMVTQAGKFAFFAVEADGMIAAVCTNANTSGNVRILYGVPEDNYLILPELDYYGIPIVRGNHKLFFGIDSHCYYMATGEARVDDEFTDSHVLKNCKDDIHARVSTETLFDSFGIPYREEYKDIHRKTYESAVLVSVYDPARPDHILAQAEIRFVNYTDWLDGDRELGIRSEILEELGINTPDNYEYTEAVLYDYWQVDNW